MKIWAFMNVLPPDGQDDDPAVPEPGDPQPDPEERLLAKESQDRLQRALASLPPRMRRCVLLRLEDLPNREIAARMGNSEQTVRSQLFMARHRLRRWYGLWPSFEEAE